MNKAQVLIPLGHSCYAWREDVSPVLVNPYTGDLGHCLLAFELARDPVEARRVISGTQNARGYRRHPCAAHAEHVKPPTPASAPKHPPQPEHKEFIANLLGVLRRAKRNGVKLTLAQLCEVLEVPTHKYRTTLRILNWLCNDGQAHRDGKNRGAVYWAEEEKRA